jgi:2-polyprenyl-3-methyl-5-hydroxy-6-metoxy-1,4-benzoquinol methylase
MQSEELAERIFMSTLGAMEMVSVHLGDQLGVYEFLRDHGPATEADVAKACGIAPRYAREFLEQQAVAGFLSTDDADMPAEGRRYELPREHVGVLVDRDHVLHSAAFPRLFTSAALQVPALLEAYRTGGGVSWSAYGEWMRTGQADANRPLFLGPLGTEMLPTLSDVHARLTDGATVADIGCGDGWSSIGIARAYPQARVDGYDVDAASIDAARRNAKEYGVDDRVTFTLVDGASVRPEGRYDLVTFFECLHDMPDPVSVLAGGRRLVADDGTVLVMDEKVAEKFFAPGDEVERMMYAYSIFVCLPDGMSHPDSVGTGTVMRPATLERYATEAGFTGLEVLPIEHETFRFYRLQH